MEAARDSRTFDAPWATFQAALVVRVQTVRAQGQHAITGTWSGPLVSMKLHPDYGPSTPQEAAGVACVGAVPWVVNYNVLLATRDLAAATRIAKAVSTRGGGLPAVEAMALPHAEGTEVACNLLDADTSPPAAVQQRVEALAAEAGLGVVRGYAINPSPSALVAQAAAMLRVV